MPNRLLTNTEVDALFRQAGLAPLRAADPAATEEVRTCRHCWHTYRAWQGPLPLPRYCCWCGTHEGPPHGTYLEQGA